MPKIKPVMAWACVNKPGEFLEPFDFALVHMARSDARFYCSDGERVVRVRISVVPKAKRKVKK